MTTDGFCFDYRKDSSYGESSFVYCSADHGAALFSILSSPQWLESAHRHVQRRLVEEWPAALGFGSLITNFPLTDAQFSCRKVRTLPPEEQPSALAAGSYKKYHTPLPPCVLSRLGRQSGFFPRKAAFALRDILRCKAAERGSLCRDAREQNSPPFGMPEGGLRIYQSCLTV